MGTGVGVVAGIEVVGGVVASTGISVGTIIVGKEARVETATGVWVGKAVALRVGPIVAVLSGVAVGPVG